jgi:hypothetical protein
MRRCPYGKTFDSHDLPGSYSHRAHIYAPQATDGSRPDDPDPTPGYTAWLPSRDAPNPIELNYRLTADR